MPVIHHLKSISLKDVSANISLFMLFNFLIRISEHPPRADKSAIIGIKLSDLTMLPLRFARGQALSAAKGLAVAPDGQGDPSLRSG